MDMTGSSSQNGNGPSANNRKLGLYKTELCRSWEEKGSCRYGSKCQFAHGEEEIRKVARHPKYKTEICRTFWVSGACPYGKRCCFIHTELPVPGIIQGSDGVPPPQVSNGRPRSLSTNSDPNETSVSLLTRIQRKSEATAHTSVALPVEAAQSPSRLFNSRPPTGSLRVDTSALNSVAKQNKSAYPTFTSNGLLLRASEQTSIKSPVPLTAGPDLGRSNNTRLDIMGFNQRLRSVAQNPDIFPSFDGPEVKGDLTAPSSPTGSNQRSSYRISSTDYRSNMYNAPHSQHVRSGSAGNWVSFNQSRHVATPSYPLPSDGSGETTSNVPWSTSELAVGSSRLDDKSWV
ncbi:hypothetical protein SERLA73DRAFT_173919 [Serpula lacrymans var. lacrymans S7.3]|uniref:C3H1-type domain-containing protein n=2 Tax=Serpula lacrymans var. lacrymans TaxID=341189 RepID=F8PFD9_SERL3|nr:uncharacterized protein SERLADRAFT_454858 [Serpula lacrymans var. lacrymans S7.9]EGO04708.1 hypothetical protein SERLA73DRAFT_173919 [Serpula lacrymans var. lacrymans S7.3]EGO30555.1 hypothetical protein SERLADRAFT_454858 [Serpula lacrymans var. lacrymans S7.9]